MLLTRHDSASGRGTGMGDGCKYFFLGRGGGGGGGRGMRVNRAYEPDSQKKNRAVLMIIQDWKQILLDHRGAASEIRHPMSG